MKERVALQRHRRRAGSLPAVEAVVVLVLLLLLFLFVGSHSQQPSIEGKSAWVWTVTTIGVVEGASHSRAITTTSQSRNAWTVQRTHMIAPAVPNSCSMLSMTIGSIPRGGGQQESARTGATHNVFVSNEGQTPAASLPHLTSHSIIYESVLVTLQIITVTFRTILPPIVTTIRTIVDFYRILPLDAILAQIGVIYAFCGGYYPTLFAAVQAAQHCGYQNMIAALQILVDEATTAVQACDLSSIKFTPDPQPSTGRKRNRARDIFTEKTKIVLATIDPVRINEAIAAIYTTWMSISIVLEREFARTIALSITIAESIQPLVSLLLNKPLQLCISADYYKWIPVIIGWVCKAMAMSLAWRIQRVLTAYTSAIAGGLMCSRALCRIAKKRFAGIRGRLGFLSRNKKTKKRDFSTAKNSIGDPNLDQTHFDEFLGYMIALCGLYSQIGQGFSFEVPFPLNLVTWPFDLAERWIQWQITKNKSTNDV